MKSLLITTAAIIGSLSQMAPAASQAEILRNRCAEQERQIKSLEKEIDSMHALIAKNNLGSTKRTIVATSASKVKSGASYTIRKGDSFSKIAKNNGVSLKALLAANKGVNPNRLKIGQRITLPGNSKVTKTTATETTKPNLGQLPATIKPGKSIVTTTETTNTSTTTTTRSYTIQAKDTLYQISRKNKISVAKILELNQGLSPNKLRIGQSIKLPGTQQTQVAVVEQKSEKSITPKAPVKKAEPAVTKQTPAQPKAPAIAPVEKPAPAVEQKKEASPAPSDEPAAYAKVRTVSVTRQMTFGDFAAEHGASVEQLNEMNNLRLSKGTVLAQGSELYIPSNND